MKSMPTIARNDIGDYNTCVSAFLPRAVIIPYEQSSSPSYKCLVQTGDFVKEGQIIAMPITDSRGVNAAITASVPGVVEDIVRCQLPNGRTGKGVRIKLTGSFSYCGKKQEKQAWRNLSPDEILKLLLTKGVKNTFLAESSLVHEILRCRMKHERYLVVRLFDEDPSRLTDTFIGQQCTNEVVEGAAVLAHLIQAQGIVFLSPKKNSVTIDNALVSEFATLNIEIDNNRYPVGYVTPIVKAIKKAVKNTQTEYFGDININSLFVDASTVYEVYEAVVLAKPITDRFVHIGGSCLRSSAILKVKIGTTFRSLCMQCGGFKIKPGKIIVNGMLCGTAITDLDTPVTSGVKSVLCVPNIELFNQMFVPCIKCGKCRSVCPEQLSPDLLVDALLQGRTLKHDDTSIHPVGLQESSVLCLDCSLCNSVCPSRIPISQIISLYKN